LNNMPITSGDLKVLNQFSTQTSKFGTEYGFVFSRKSFPGHSPRPTVVCRPPRPSKVNVTYSAAKPQPSLNQLAHQATRSDFEIYPQFRLPVSSFGPRRSNDFLVRHKIHTPSNVKENIAAMIELNRMARLVEITSSRITHVPFYSDPPRLSTSLASDRVSHAVVAELLGFTKFGFAIQDFRTVFPSTARPTVSMFSGQPRVPKAEFNELLISKLSTLRSKLGINFTPSGSLNLIASWINRLLCFRPKTLPTNKGKSSHKEKKMTSAAEKTAKDTKVSSTSPSLADRFTTTAIDTPASPPATANPPPVTSESASASTDSSHDLIHAVSDLRIPLRTALARQKLALPFVLPDFSPLLQLLSVEHLRFTIASDHTSSTLFVVSPGSVNIRYVNWGPSPKDETSQYDADHLAGNVNLVTALPPLIATLLDVMSPFTSL
jgi:hypothetical protein